MIRPPINSTGPGMPPSLTRVVMRPLIVSPTGSSITIDDFAELGSCVLMNHQLTSVFSSLCEGGGADGEYLIAEFEDHQSYELEHPLHDATLKRLGRQPYQPPQATSDRPNMPPHFGFNHHG
jgi:hypothetical protein